MDLSISKRNKINLGLESISGHMTLNQIIQSVKPAVSKLGKFTKPIVVSDFDELKKIVSGDLPRDYIQFMVSVGSMGNENLLGHPEWALKVITDMQKNATYWNLSWLPINEDGFGNYLVIDTAGVSGTKGAVLDCHHEKQWGNNNHPPKKFNSFIDFLNSDLFKVPYLDWMRTNKIIVSLESIDTTELAGSQGIFSLDFIARQAYQAVQQLAVDMGQPQIIPWESASAATQESTKAGVLFYIQNPTATAEQVHESWMARKASEGWSCGDAKDETNKTHPCMRPYGELDIQHKLKDHIFMYVVNAFIEAYGEEATSKISVGEPNANWYENTMVSETPSVESDFSPIVRYAGVETYYNTTMDLDLDESTPGVEGIGDIFSSIGKWFRNINAEKVDGNVNALLSPETVKMINSTIRSPKWRKEQELKRGKISSPRVAPMLGLPGKFKSGDFLNNIKDSESKLKQLLPGYLKAISEHSDAIVAINKKAKVDWGQAKDSDAKIEIIKQALAAIRALEHPTTYYAKMKVETIGCIIPFTVNGEAGWKRNQDVDFPKEIDALTPEQFNAACDRFIEIYDEFKQPTSEFFDKIISAAEYVPVSTGGPFWDLIKKETNGGKLYLNYGLSCVTSKQVESLVYDSVFALWYQFSLRGLIAWIGSSVH